MAGPCKVTFQWERAPPHDLSDVAVLLDIIAEAQNRSANGGAEITHFVLRVCVVDASESDKITQESSSGRGQNSIGDSNTLALVAKPLMLKMPMDPILSSGFGQFLRRKGFFKPILLIVVFASYALQVWDPGKIRVVTPAAGFEGHGIAAQFLPHPLTRLATVVIGLFGYFLVLHAVSKPLFRRIRGLFDFWIVVLSGMCYSSVRLFSWCVLMKHVGILSPLMVISFASFEIFCMIPFSVLVGSVDAVMISQRWKLLLWTAALLGFGFFYYIDRFRRAWLDAEICYWTFCSSAMDVLLHCRATGMVFVAKFWWALMTGDTFALLKCRYTHCDHTHENVVHMIACWPKICSGFAWKKLARKQKATVSTEIVFDHAAKYSDITQSAQLADATKMSL